MCVKPARCHAGKNYSSNSNLQNHMDIKQGDCLSCNSGSSMNRLLQVTDTDSGRRIHVPAKIRYGHLLFCQSVKLFQVFTRSDCIFAGASFTGGDNNLPIIKLHFGLSAVWTGTVSLTCECRRYALWRPLNQSRPSGAGAEWGTAIPRSCDGT